MIKYFATNRSMHDLAAHANGREDRVKLQTGGYYFVDMEEYMAYYLGEVETSRLPPSAIVSNSEKDILDGFLSSRAIGSIVVCVHGFNVELFEAFTWFRILTDTMRNQASDGSRIVTNPLQIDDGTPPGSLTAFVGFSWPSNGNVVSYISDQNEARGSAPAFGGFLARLRCTGKPVNLICHSMGNYLVCHALKYLVNQEGTSRHLLENEMSNLVERRKKGSDGHERFVDTLVMLAADVERRHVIKAEGHNALTDYIGPFFSGLEHLVGRIYNVYSRYDSALRVSELEKKPRDAVLAVGDALSSVSAGLLSFLERNPDQKWEKRLGSAPHPPAAPGNFESINATEVAGRKIDHSDHIDSAELVGRIAKCLGI